MADQSHAAVEAWSLAPLRSVKSTGVGEGLLGFLDVAQCAWPVSQPGSALVCPHGAGLESSGCGDAFGRYAKGSLRALLLSFEAHQAPTFESLAKKHAGLVGARAGLRFADHRIHDTVPPPGARRVS